MPQKQDELVPDPRVRQEFGITDMTMWRWDRDPQMVALGWPPPVKIRNRNYRSASGLQLFRDQLVRQALVRRGTQMAQRLEAQHA